MFNHFNHAVILAAGRGERMKPLTNYCPKALVEFRGRPLISYAIEEFRFVSRLHVTVGHLSSLIFNQIHNNADTFINTTGQSNAWFLFNSVIREINEPILCCPCDLLFKIDLEALYAEAKDHKRAAGIVTIPRIYGAEADFVSSENGRCIRIDRSTPSLTCAAGIQVLNPARINQLLNDKIYTSFYEVWNDLISLHELSVFNTQPSRWEAVDRLDQLQ